MNEVIETDPLAVSADEMRGLLVAMGAVEYASQNGMSTWAMHNDDLCAAFVLTINGWMDESKRSWFILACAEYLESEAVSSQFTVAMWNSGITEITPTSAIVAKQRIDPDDTTTITGPFARRVVKAASVVAGMMQQRGNSDAE